MGNPCFTATLQQVTRCTSVVAVVFEWIGDRFRYDGVSGEVEHRIDLIALQQIAHQFAVRSVSHHQISKKHGILMAGAEVVQNHQPFTPFAELTHHVTADITGSTSYQNPFLHIIFPA